MLSLSLPAWMRTALLLFALLMFGVVHAQPRHIDDRRVTAADVANAIRNSPNASPWLRANADAVANLAMFESGGRLGVYNGSCCFGVLQMNRTNIRAYAGVSPEVFRTWSLQDQVNAWSRLTDDALRSRVPRALIAMGTFDGRPVDGNLVLACVQLGIGNCQRMIQSGRCSGFADRNGTTICAMADRTVAGRSIVFGLSGVRIAPEHVFTVDGDAVDEQQATFDQACQLPLPGLATGLTILHVTFIHVRVNVPDAKRDEDLALCSHILSQAIHHFNGFTSADPKVEVGVVGLLSVAAQGGNAAGEERLGSTASIAPRFNPTDAVQITNAIDVQVEVVGLGGSSHGDLQRKKDFRRSRSPASAERPRTGKRNFPVRVAK